MAVTLFYQVGELFESCAAGRSRKSIATLMDIRPDSANVERDGEIETDDPEEVAAGGIIAIRPGERIPLDGTIFEGNSSIDTVALTGEPVPPIRNERQDLGPMIYGAQVRVYARQQRENPRNLRFLGRPGRSPA